MLDQSQVQSKKKRKRNFDTASRKMKNPLETKTFSLASFAKRTGGSKMFGKNVWFYDESL